MNTTNIPSAAAPVTTDRANSNRAEDRQRLQTLAAEFESMLLVNVLRDMRTSGRWSEESGTDMLGAETFNQTFDVELSQYLAKSGGFGLSQRLLSVFDALDRAVNSAAGGAATMRSSAAATSAAATGAAKTSAAAGGLIPTSGSATGAGNSAYTGRTGWNNMRLEAPPYGGSGAVWAGFNNDRAMGGGDEKSVKDAFFRWTYGQSFNPAGKSKEEIASFLRNNMQSAREYGLNILDVKGEQILIETKERGAEWVDVVASAGSSNPGETKWQWLCMADEGVPVGGNGFGAALADLRSLPGGDERLRTLLTGNTATGDALLSSLQAEAFNLRIGNATAGTRTVETLPSTPAELRNVDARVTSGFGWRQDPFTGGTRFHKGIDVRAAEGDRVASTGAGRVAFAGTDGGYGTTVVVEHADGLSTRYAHLSAAMVAVGDEIADGQVIGLAGRTGRATAPHLHYEVMVDGRAVAPFQGR